MTETEWRDAINRHTYPGPRILEAQTFLKGWETFSKPRVLSTRDGSEFVVKMRQQGRPVMDGALYIEQVAGRLGLSLGAPVAPVEIINVSQALIDMNPAPAELGPMIAGLAHASQRILDVSERGNNFADAGLAENRPRYALLAVLYGFVAVVSDHQFFYANFDPRLVYSFDHGWALGHQGQEWDIQHLAAAPPAVPDAIICHHCVLQNNEIEGALDQLMLVTEDMIACAVAAPPATWNVTLADRIQVAVLLTDRRDVLLAAAGRRAKRNP